MKIGFFGDSFSAENPPRILNKYSTYISLLEKEYKTNIPIYSRGGTSHWDVIINQFLPRINDLPDICIFTWPNEHRLFHRKVRNIIRSTALVYSQEKYKFLKIGCNFGLYKNEWTAAEMFYRHLFDEEKNEIEYKASLHYFDNVIIDKLKNKKFIHLWSFDQKHIWKNNIELSEPLIKIAERMIPNYYPADGQIDNANSLSPNHLPGQELNDYVFEKVKGLIDEIHR